jgi:hypothetical protein
MILTGALASPMMRGLGVRSDNNDVSLGVVVVLPGANPQATRLSNNNPSQNGKKRCMLTSLRITHTNLRGTTDETTAIITTIGANRPGQVNYMVTADTAPAQGGMTMGAQNEFVVDTALTLWADKLFFNVVAQVFFFEGPLVAI